jgi:hypothetical protein
MLRTEPFQQMHGAVQAAHATLHTHLRHLSPLCTCTCATRHHSAHALAAPVTTLHMHLRHLSPHALHGQASRTPDSATLVVTHALVSSPAPACMAKHAAQSHHELYTKLGPYQCSTCGHTSLSVLPAATRMTIHATWSPRVAIHVFQSSLLKHAWPHASLSRPCCSTHGRTRHYLLCAAARVATHASQPSLLLRVWPHATTAPSCCSIIALLIIEPPWSILVGKRLKSFLAITPRNDRSQQIIPKAPGLHSMYQQPAHHPDHTAKSAAVQCFVGPTCAPCCATKSSV